MAPQPPPYGSQEYWNQRFSSNTDTFEWLETPDTLERYISDALSTSQDEDPQVLHVGCGTSSLSFYLSMHVKSPRQIHNLDYSQVAIEVGVAKERELSLYRSERRGTDDHGPDDNDVLNFMRWSAVDLLDYKTVIQACNKSTYSVIVDKATTDSIACSDDVTIPIPYPIATSPWTPGTTPANGSHESTYPLNVLAVNLALTAKPKARWICLSYSNDRFNFAEWSAPRCGFPHIGQLWNVLGKYAMDKATPATETETETRDGTITHRPKIFNWVYVLERTERALYVREQTESMSP
ncbi:hypothetical protein IAQ61_006076 [Plenodomus lingam]|uniref:Methyltransferase domain-containing protein n=1 Tax=Leptosphaeria maculans (strain JN3 / isolate v23.1.3 / race Av1-4-5-6-7-8) TaxID=985895 RepID=E4ZMS6_LEPMJ|nr:hypothetical protein LEMA_P052350.1 [Plenodomus lingam JN3]KAH9870599.1 hypothetical protein IAQ61_006076 [Plenodomus lingam]CBX92529.1 hypothetical protein LEMA_P052350.1 [Plenodomus lingam JN3]